MKTVKSFNNFSNEYIIEKNINIYQNKIKKFYKDSDIEVHNTLTYETSVISLIQVIEKLVDIELVDIIMVSIFCISTLTNESKTKAKEIYDYLKNNNIEDNTIDIIYNQLKNIKYIFDLVLERMDKKNETYIDMLNKTKILIPFLSVIKYMIDDNLLDSSVLSVPENEINDIIDNILVHRILHKLGIIIGNPNKFQNKDNLKPLRINDELKSPFYKTIDTYIEKKNK